MAVETDMYMFREIEMTSIYRKLETLYPENDYTGKNRIFLKCLVTEFENRDFCI